jgi:TolB-like protein/DNA-binding winged helix-turn-helix (wHTH) protein/lipopolysaccharide biosynthesis regulator YciM
MDVGRHFRVGDWTVEPALDEIRLGERRVKLEPRMMRLLCCLAERPGEVVPTGTLLDRVWPGVVVSQSSVYQAVAQLRRELGDRDAPPRYIATVPRKGYRLVAPVGPAETGVPGPVPAALPPDLAPPPANAAPAAPPAAASRPAWRRSGRRALAGALFAAVLAVAAGAMLWGGGKPAEAPAPAVAVVPFADLGLEEGGEAFSAGLTDELLNALARVPGLRVIGRTSSARFADGATDVRDIGRQLGVTHVVEGSVRRAGRRLRVTVQLISTADGFEVWANSFDRPVADTMAIQAEIARAVVDAVAVQLSAAAAERLARVPTTQVNAYDLYLLGRHQQLKRTPEALARAIEHHRAALEADPGFALAHAGLADAYMARYYYENRPLAETAGLVQKEVDAALRLDPELAEAYAAWAVLLTEQWRTAEAIRALERALAINPNYGEAWLRLGAAFEYAGEPRKALEAYDQAALLDPLHTVMHVRRCLALQNLGRHADAEAACQRAFELQPEIPNALWARGLNAYAQGDLVDAVRHHREALERAPNRRDIRGELVMLYLDLGMTREASAEIVRLAETAEPLEAALATARLHLAAADANAALRELREFPPDAAPRERAEAALLALAAGDIALARGLDPFPQAGARPIEEVLQPGLYRTRWGTCELCGAALLQRAAGDDAEAARLLDVIASFLDRIERAGHAWHALHYLRAGVLAQRGDAGAALDSLERAVAMGWRRGWWMRVDPALAPLRGEDRFMRLLATVEAASGAARSRLAPAAR